MDKYKCIILCEGVTDQALIGTYLETTSGWRYFDNKANLPLRSENLRAYNNAVGEFLGIWQVGGNNFENKLEVILQGAKKDEIVERIAIVTDHDGEEAEESRLKGVCDILFSSLQVGPQKTSDFINKWSAISYDNAFGKAEIGFCYILVPLDETGALETFMMNALSEKNVEQGEVISQAKDFVRNFKSEKYLKKRREKIKAELGVSLSVFSPDRIFTTMKGLLDEVPWNEFDATKVQFNALKEL